MPPMRGGPDVQRKRLFALATSARGRLCKFTNGRFVVLQFANCVFGQMATKTKVDSKLGAKLL